MHRNVGRKGHELIHRQTVGRRAGNQVEKPADHRKAQYIDADQHCPASVHAIQQFIDPYSHSLLLFPVPTPFQWRLIDQSGGSSGIFPSAFPDEFAVVH